MRFYKAISVYTPNWFLVVLLNWLTFRSLNQQIFTHFKKREVHTLWNTSAGSNAVLRLVLGSKDSQPVALWSWRGLLLVGKGEETLVKGQKPPFLRKLCLRTWRKEGREAARQLASGCVCLSPAQGLRDAGWALEDSVHWLLVVLGVEIHTDEDFTWTKKSSNKLVSLTLTVWCH